MAVLAYTDRARQDLLEIDEYLFEHAGSRVADRYSFAFEKHAERLQLFPGSGAPRPRLGADVRIAVEWPYVMLYRHSGDEVVILRVLDGRRRISRKLVQGLAD